MRLLISMVFAGVLASSNNAFASENLFSPGFNRIEREPTEQELIESKKKMDEEISKGKKAELILLKGNVITSRWLEDTHHTRVIYKGTYYACVTLVKGGHLYARCVSVKSPSNQ